MRPLFKVLHIYSIYTFHLPPNKRVLRFQTIGLLSSVVTLTLEDPRSRLLPLLSVLTSNPSCRHKLLSRTTSHFPHFMSVKEVLALYLSPPKKQCPLGTRRSSVCSCFRRGGVVRSGTYRKRRSTKTRIGSRTRSTPVLHK